MKKLFFVAAIAVICTTSLTSCRKDHSCVCTISGTTVIPNSSKKNAKTICDLANVNESLAGGSCTLD